MIFLLLVKFLLQNASNSSCIPEGFKASVHRSLKGATYRYPKCFTHAKHMKHACETCVICAPDAFETYTFTFVKHMYYLCELYAMYSKQNEGLFSIVRTGKCKRNIHNTQAIMKLYLLRLCFRLCRCLPLFPEQNETFFCANKVLF